MTTLCKYDLSDATFKALPRIDSKFSFYQLAKGREMPVSTYEDACRFDVALRRDRVGYVPSALLRAWYGRGGRK